MGVSGNWGSDRQSRKERLMAKFIEDEVAYYYDFHPTEEDLMGETPLHATLIRYLMLVLLKLFEGQRCAVYENFNFYQTPNPNEYPLAPDIAVIKGVDYRDDIRSWRVGKTGPSPHVVFEIASEETWKKDLLEKPLRYAQMGVQEYLAYDPNEPPLRRGDSRRLFGWHLTHNGAQPLPSGPDGRLWSTQLDSFLIPDGQWLRLTDKDGLPRLTQAEAADRRAETAVRRAEAEARRAETLAEKLRSLGIDPDQL
jgi:Uma2 family endonuclease